MVKIWRRHVKPYFFRFRSGSMLDEFFLTQMTKK
jgi:hypothetical protein